MSEGQSFIEVERDGAVLILTITRTERSNALHSAAHFELSRHFDDFEQDPGLRVAIITGAGNRSFCAGNDLKVQAEGGSMERPPSGFAGLTTRRNRTKPVIAAVNGVALGGGFEIVLACDLAVAVPNARFALPETRHGLVPLAGMHILPRQVGRKAAMGLLLAGKAFTPEQAINLGLINEICAENDALASARKLAVRVLRSSPAAIKACLGIVSDSLDEPSVWEALSKSYPQLERLRESPDFIEGPRAFSEGREPSWSSGENG